MKNLKNSLAGGVLFSALLSSAVVADTIKVGVLHSLSGTMAISETTLKDTMLMLIEEQNAKGGVDAAMEYLAEQVACVVD